MKNMFIKPLLNVPRGNRVTYTGLFFVFIVAVLLAACEGKPAAMNVANNSRYDPREVFDLQFMSNVITPSRSASGIPGPAYWQNRANYKITAKLDESRNLLRGRVEINYTNNSPDNLHYLWIQLYQNIYRNDSRAALTVPYENPRADRITDGMRLYSVSAFQGAALEKISYYINDTNMRIDLTKPVLKHGGKIHLAIDYSFALSSVYYGPWTRMGVMDTEGGPVFAVSHWYPRMIVYDDVHGWNTVPYRGIGEFFLDYGDFDYTIEVPWNYIVVGTGALINRNAVLTRDEIAKLDEAARSDKTIHIVAPSDVGEINARPVSSGRLTWHFQAHNVRDVAWAASPAFVLDAVKIKLPDNKSALAIAAYPRDIANVPDGWSHAADDLKQEIEFFSKQFFPYPWPTATAVAAPVFGMEYPAIVFLKADFHGYLLSRGLTHEIGHTWFPMIVGSNEHLYTWMDEGFDTFIDSQAFDIFNRGINRSGLDTNTANYIADVLNREKFPIMTAADNIPEEAVYKLEYKKAAYGLSLLRNYILAQDNFDHAFKDYIVEWAYRHPTPYDFFRLMNNETGENLDWFWKEWYFEDWKLDQAVTDVSYVDNDPKKGSIITIMNNDKMAMPIVVAVHESGGKTTIIKLPVEIWADGNTWKFKVNTSSKISSVVIDPEKLLPDADRTNNTWNGPP